MKVWFITGTSRGFGRAWAQAALERGDRVVATARDLGAIADLASQHPETTLALQLDVTDRAAVFAAVARAHEHFGQLDVVVNNAGYGLFGAVEEVSEAEARAQIETNLFGALWVTQAALPILRAQGSGHVVQVSSIGGVTAYPDLGLYHASKWGLEGFSQALSQETAGFGIKVTIVEPGGFATDWATSSAVHVTAPLPPYAPLHEGMAQAFASVEGTQPTAEATAQVLLDLVDLEAPPLRLFLGAGVNEAVHAEYAQRLAEWDAHKALSERAG
jgi:NAD(P)-dependent dehydrogenase (short-subunit alcohol dehydrogenase family)